MSANLCDTRYERSLSLNYHEPDGHLNGGQPLVGVNRGKGVADVLVLGVLEADVDRGALPAHDVRSHRHLVVPGLGHGHLHRVLQVGEAVGEGALTEPEVGRPEVGQVAGETLKRQNEKLS